MNKGQETRKRNEQARRERHRQEMEEVKAQANALQHSPAHFLAYLNPLLNPFCPLRELPKIVKTRYPLQDNGFSWSCWADSNRRPHPYQGCALPTELQQHMRRDCTP